MTDFILTAVSPLGGYEREFTGVSLRELPNLTIVAVSIPLGEEQSFARALKVAYGVEGPNHGCSVILKGGEIRIVRFAADQVLVLFDHDEPYAAQVVSEALKGGGYAVDQTHNWVALALSGLLSRVALERICAINLHKDVFAIDGAERTVMEHLGVIVVRIGEDEFMLMSASSSAKSFLHAIETSIIYVS